MTETEKIGAMLRKNAPPDEEEILSGLIAEFLAGGRRAEMLTGQRYYENEGDILSRCRWQIGRNGERIPGREPASRIAHGFARKLVDQKAQYLFGRPFTIRCEDKGLLSELEAVFDKGMRARMRMLVKEAVNKGVAWLMAVPEGSRVRFSLIPSEEVIPVWKDGDRNGTLERVLRLIPMERVERGRSENFFLVQAWDAEGVREYRYEKGRMIPEGEKRAHFFLGGEGMLYERLPFIPFRYNDEELPLIRFIKPLIDDYDLLKSKDSDALGETSGALMVLHNYDGTDLGEFRENLSRYRAVKVSDGGGLEVIGEPVYTDKLLAHLEQDRKDIYEIGRGVDTQVQSVGNASGVAMKFRYADLDLDCAGIESSFAEGFDGIVFFTALFSELFGRGSYEGVRAEMVLNHDIIISESDAIGQCADSGGILSKRTILENHPWVVNAEQELERIREEEAEVGEDDSGDGGSRTGSGAC